MAANKYGNKSLYNKSFCVCSMPELEYPGEVHDFNNISDNIILLSLSNRYMYSTELHSPLNYKSKLFNELNYYSSIPVPLYGYDLIETTRYNDEDDL